MSAALWEDSLVRLRSEWEAIDRAPVEQVDVDAWTSRLVHMREEMHGLQRAGRWARAPHDLLSIVGLNRWELAHSAAIGWLCSPEAGHGLGTSFLDALVSLTGGSLELGEPVNVVLEESRLVPLGGSSAVLEGGGADPDSGDDVEAESTQVLTRADVVVRGPGGVLVIEVKVDAGEQPDQAQRLYDGWSDEGDSRFIFLTRTGGLPSTIAPELRDNWTGLSWRDLRATLEVMADEANGSAVARPALLDYLHTLRTTF